MAALVPNRDVQRQNAALSFLARARAHWRVFDEPLSGTVGFQSTTLHFGAGLELTVVV